MKYGRIARSAIAGLAIVGVVASARTEGRPGDVAPRPVLTGQSDKGLRPSDLQARYGVTDAAAKFGRGQRVYIIGTDIAGNLENDLDAYRTSFGLPSCKQATGCLQFLHANGGRFFPTPSSPTPDTKDTFAVTEAAEAVSAVCPLCEISVMYLGLMWWRDDAIAGTVLRAFNAHYIVSVTSMQRDPAGSLARFPAFLWDGSVMTASSAGGSVGYQATPWWPAGARSVLAVGSTSLQQTETGYTETAWANSGSFCVTTTVKPDWQRPDVRKPSVSSASCSGLAGSDVSAAATGPDKIQVVYRGMLTRLSGNAFPPAIVAGLAALDPPPEKTDNPVAYVWDNFRSSPLNDAFHDIVTGDPNGACTAPALCTPGTGWDGPTGVGTPNGLAAFEPPPEGPNRPAPERPTALWISAKYVKGDKSTLCWSVPKGTASVWGSGVSLRSCGDANYYQKWRIQPGSRTNDGRVLKEFVLLTDDAAGLGCLTKDDITAASAKLYVRSCGVADTSIMQQFAAEPGEGWKGPLRSLWDFFAIGGGGDLVTADPRPRKPEAWRATPAID
jgi:hypothetical protein